jgi:hypothetical protein
MYANPQPPTLTATEIFHSTGLRPAAAPPNFGSEHDPA